MSIVRVCFMGTPEFAAEHLECLLRDEHYQVVGVVTQPDRPAGRSMKLTPSPVKQLAQARGIEVLTPEKVSTDSSAIERIKSWKAEVAIVVAYGQILRQSFMDLFPLGAVNIHGSLLPKWRGAAPIQRSLEAGDYETGVTLQKMVLKLDAGPIIGMRKIPLDDSMNSVELFSRMAQLGCQLLSVELMDYVRGNLIPVSQDESLVTIAHKISKDEAKLDFQLPARTLHNRIRGFAIGPGTFAYLGKPVFETAKRVKFHRTSVSDKSTAFASSAPGVASLAPGTVLAMNPESIEIQCGEGVLRVHELQLEGKPKQLAEQFIQSVQLNQFKNGVRFD